MAPYKQSSVFNFKNIQYVKYIDAHLNDYGLVGIIRVADRWSRCRDLKYMRS